MMEKSCSKCKLKLSVSCFNKNKTKKDGFNNQCKSCIKKYKYSKEQKKAWPSNKIKNDKRKERYQKNKEKYAAQGKESYLKYRDKRLEKMRQYYLLNIDERKSYNKKYRNETKSSIYLRNRARKLKIKNKISIKEIKKLIEDSNNICFWCHKDIKTMHLDHYVPLSKNGEHSITNLVVSCDKCNLIKGSKMPEEFSKILEKILLERNNNK